MTRTPAEPKLPPVLESISPFIELSKSVRSRHGRLASVGAVMATVIVTGWWLWPAITDRPFVESVIEFLHPRGIPRAVSGRANVAVALLEGDSHTNDARRLILDGLQQFEGVEPLRLERVLLPGSAPAESIILQQRIGADILAWGTVFEVQSTTAVRLYWRSNQSAMATTNDEKYVPDVETLTLPPLFVRDLMKILSLLVETHLLQSEPVSEGSRVSRDFYQRIVEAQRLLAQPRESWAPDDRVQLETVVARALDTYARRTGSREDLDAAISLHEKILDDSARIQLPSARASTLGRLGVDLLMTGEKELNVSKLRAAAAAFRHQLTLLNRQVDPMDWAAAQANLSDSLRLLSLASGDVELAQEAVASAEAASAVSDRFSGSLARVRHLIGMRAYADFLFAVRFASDKLGPADFVIAQYKAAVEHTSPQRAPLERARMEGELAAVLVTIGDANAEPSLIREAIATSNHALSSITRDQSSSVWVDLMLTLASAQRASGSLEPGARNLEQAVETYRTVLPFLTRAADRVLWAGTEYLLSTALRDLGFFRADRTLLREAVESARAALEIFTRSEFKTRWAQATVALAGAEESLGELEGDHTRWHDAVSQCRSALEVLSEDHYPLDWARAQNLLGLALENIGVHEKDAGALRGSRRAFQASLGVFRRSRRLRSTAAQVQENLARVEAALNR